MPEPQLSSDKPVTDVVLIGAGIMSATLGVLLKALNPGLTIAVYERLDAVAAESSDAWNNAGTGHSAFCELNYTPERPDGSIDISKADKIAEQFELSKQFWASLVREGQLPDPTAFIHTIPHMSFVWGAANVEYLRKRHAALLHSPLFQGLEFSDDPIQIANWIPLVMAGRDPATPQGPGLDGRPTPPPALVQVIEQRRVPAANGFHNVRISHRRTVAESRRL